MSVLGQVQLKSIDNYFTCIMHIQSVYLSQCRLQLFMISQLLGYLEKKAADRPAKIKINFSDEHSRMGTLIENRFEGRDEYISITQFIYFLFVIFIGMVFCALALIWTVMVSTRSFLFQPLLVKVPYC